MNSSPALTSAAGAGAVLGAPAVVYVLHDILRLPAPDSEVAGIIAVVTMAAIHWVSNYLNNRAARLAAPAADPTKPTA